MTLNQSAPARNLSTVRKTQHINTSRTYRGSGFLAILPAFLLGLALVLVSCQDQPIDNGEDGTVRLDTTVILTVDTVVINDTDTVIVTRVDTTFVTLTDTVKVEVTKRDTIRDTIERYRVDTIEVPTGENRRRTVRLVVTGRDMGAGGVIDSFAVDVSDWFNYRAVDSAGSLAGLGLTMSVGMPPRFREVDLGLGRSTTPFTLEGLALFVPIFRPNLAANNTDEFELEEHPYDFKARESRNGGVLLSYRKAGGEIRNAWTGNVFDVDGSPRPGEYRSRGTVTILSVDHTRRMVAGRITALIFLPDEQNGVLGVVPVNLRIEFELGW